MFMPAAGTRRRVEHTCPCPGIENVTNQSMEKYVYIYIFLNRLPPLKQRQRLDIYIRRRWKEIVEANRGGNEEEKHFSRSKMKPSSRPKIHAGDPPPVESSKGWKRRGMARGVGEMILKSQWQTHDV